MIFWSNSTSSLLYDASCGSINGWRSLWVRAGDCTSLPLAFITSFDSRKDFVIIINSMYTFDVHVHFSLQVTDIRVHRSLIYAGTFICWIIFRVYMIKIFCSNIFYQMWPIKRHSPWISTLLSGVLSIKRFWNIPYTYI